MEMCSPHYADRQTTLFAGAGVRAFAVHPGTIVTELGHLTADDIARLQGRASTSDATLNERSRGPSPSNPAFSPWRSCWNRCGIPAGVRARDGKRCAER